MFPHTVDIHTTVSGYIGMPDKAADGKTYQVDNEEETDMASTKEYFDFVLEQLSGLEEINSRTMMGE